MTDATTDLGEFIIELTQSFDEASQGGWTLEVVESIVIALDSATVEECGIPMISASFALVGGVDELPCWQLTGVAYPSYAPTECLED